MSEFRRDNRDEGPYCMREEWRACY